MGTLNKQQIVDSLLEYLPEISISLVGLVSDLQQLINEQLPKDSTGTILVRLDPLLNNLQKLLQMTEGIKDTDIEPDVFKLYRQFATTLVLGIREMIDWITIENQSEAKLHESVGHLFTAGQQIIELVNKITQN